MEGKRGMKSPFGIKISRFSMWLFVAVVAVPFGIHLFLSPLDLNWLCLLDNLLIMRNLSG